MPSVHEYIDEIDRWRDVLADELTEKGIDASESEKLNTLIPKVLQIGGSASYNFPEIQIAGQSVNDYITAIDYWRDNLANVLVVKGVEALTSEKLNTLVPKVANIPSAVPEYSDTNKTTVILLDSNGNRTDQIQQFAPQTSNPLYGVKSFLQSNLSNKYDIVIGKDFMTGYSGGAPGVIQNRAFLNCTNLVHLEVYCTSTGDDTTFVNELGDQFCDGCTSLKSVVFPPSLRNIDFRTFKGCTALVGTMKLPSEIESIGSGAFRGCSSIQKFEIPASINSIHISAFRDCTALQEIVIDKPQDSIANAPWTWDDSAFNPANVTVTWTG